MGYAEKGKTEGRPYLNYFDSSITQVSGEMDEVSNDGVDGGDLGLVGADYNFSSHIEPVYTVDNAMPREVRFLQKQTTVNMDIRNPDLKQTYNGNNMELQFRLMDSGSQVMESFKVRGKLYSQNTTATVGQYISNSLSLRQDSYQDSPTITSYSCTACTGPGSALYIFGTNLENTVSIRFQNDEATDWYVFGDASSYYTLRCIIPPEAIDGPIEVETLGGIAIGPPYNINANTSIWNA